jgi:hypothetical protein
MLHAHSLVSVLHVIIIIIIIITVLLLLSA